jgi:serine phosphatase RsbU (regulator of sigma subunit)
MREFAAATPHDLARRIVTVAERECGGRTALYLPDVEGRILRRIAGGGTSPEEITADGAIGPELPPGALRTVLSVAADEWPHGVVEPITVMGRAIALLIAPDGGDADALADVALAAAQIIELAGGYTDTFERARRRRPASAAAEVQLSLMPPRFAPLRGAVVAASVLPAYDVGGDWFDYADNEEGVWIAVADAVGKGDRAAALAALSVGAFRAARRGHADLADCCRSIHEALEAFAPTDFVTAVIARFDPEDKIVSWTSCGHPFPLLVRDGKVSELTGEASYPLGILTGDRPFPENRAQLRSGDRLYLYSDGLTEHSLRTGTRTDLAHLTDIIERHADAPPGGLVAAVEASIVAQTGGRLRDDATQLVLNVS